MGVGLELLGRSRRRTIPGTTDVVLDGRGIVPVGTQSRLELALVGLSLELVLGQFGTQPLPLPLGGLLLLLAEHGIPLALLPFHLLASFGHLLSHEPALLLGLDVLLLLLLFAFGPLGLEQGLDLLHLGLLFFGRQRLDGDGGLLKVGMARLVGVQLQVGHRTEDLATLVAFVGLRHAGILGNEGDGLIDVGILGVLVEPLDRTLDSTVAIEQTLLSLEESEAHGRGESFNMLLVERFGRIDHLNLLLLLLLLVLLGGIGNGIGIGSRGTGPVLLLVFGVGHGNIGVGISLGIFGCILHLHIFGSSRLGIFRWSSSWCWRRCR